MVLVFPKEFDRTITGPICLKTRDNVLKRFSGFNHSSIDLLDGSADCERYCSVQEKCRACVKICDLNCYWNAISVCSWNTSHNEIENTGISLKPGKIFSSFICWNQLETNINISPNLLINIWVSVF